MIRFFETDLGMMTKPCKNDGFSSASCFWEDLPRGMMLKDGSRVRIGDQEVAGQYDARHHIKPKHKRKTDEEKQLIEVVYLHTHMLESPSQQDLRRLPFMCRSDLQQSRMLEPHSSSKRCPGLSTSPSIHARLDHMLNPLRGGCYASHRSQRYPDVA